MALIHQSSVVFLMKGTCKLKVHSHWIIDMYASAFLK